MPVAVPEQAAVVSAVQDNMHLMDAASSVLDLKLYQIGKVMVTL